MIEQTKDELVEKGILLSKKEMIFSKVKLKELEKSNDVEDWIDEYRILFKGKKVGAMGDRKACVEKMRVFLSQNDYSKDEILSATERYIKSLDNRAYLQQADYFINKRMGDGTETSRLRNFCEEIQERADDYEEFSSPFKLI